MAELDNLSEQPFAQLEFPFHKPPRKRRTAAEVVADKSAAQAARLARDAEPKPPKPPKPKFRRAKRPNWKPRNIMAERYAPEGAALLAFVQTHADLAALLDACLERLHKRKVYKLDPMGASPLRRARILVYNRRAVFLELGRMAVPRYVTAMVHPAPAFTEYPERVVTAFSAQCVRIYLFQKFGDAEIEPA